MSEVPVWHLFAYMNDDPAQDEKRRLSDWQVQDAVRWCSARGFDHIYLYRDEAETVRFQKAPPAPVRGAIYAIEDRHAHQGDDAA